MADQVIGDVLSIVLDITTKIVLAAIRPWRYLLSRSYRQKTDHQFAQSGTATKGWLVLQMGRAILANVALAGFIAWVAFDLQHRPEKPLTEHQKVMEAIETGIFKAVISHASN